MDSRKISTSCIDELCKYHNEWIKIAYSFLNNKHDAEDIVQDMYLRLDGYGVQLDDIKYKKGINKSYIFTIIRNMSLDLLKSKKLETIELIEQEDVNRHEEYLVNIPRSQQEIALEKLLSKIHKEINTWHPYNRILFEQYMYSGLSLRDISTGTDKKPRRISNYKIMGKNATKNGCNISVRSLFNTLKNCKVVLKEKLEKDFKHYLNNEFDKIT